MSEGKNINQENKSKLISSIVFSVVFAIFCVLAIVVMPRLFNNDTSELVGRVITLRSSKRVEGYYETYLEFEEGNIARFSSDIGNEVKYTKSGTKLTFSDVYFQGKQYEKLTARIVGDSNYKDNEVYQYYFLAIYDDSAQIAYTYPDDTVFKKWDIEKTFAMRSFEIADEDPPEREPEAHLEPAQLSAIDQKAHSFFGNVKSISFLKNDVCVAVTNDDNIIEGKYHQFIYGKLYLNFGEAYTTEGQFIQMKITTTAPAANTGSPYWNNSPSSQAYDPDYSNITPPPYYQNDQLFIYWAKQDSTYVVR